MLLVTFEKLRSDGRKAKPFVPRKVEDTTD
jgi:hypothetical protein